MIVVQDKLALARSLVYLHQGLVGGQEPNEVATEHFQHLACVTAVLEYSEGLYHAVAGGQNWFHALASQGRECAMGENMDGREREESQSIPCSLAGSFGERRFCTLSLVVSPIIFQLELCVLSWAMLPILALVVMLCNRMVFGT